MKAMVYTEYGPPEVLSLEEIDKPAVGDADVLIEVHASSLNFGDVALLKGSPFVARFSSGVRKPKYPVLGGDVAGRVVETGRSVKQFRPGDEVFADNGRFGFGAYAEYVTVPQSALAPKPANATFAEAGAAPQAAVVALQGLRDAGGIQPGHKVLINGASGGIGPYAVQIAKAYGAHVTAVCSTPNLDLVHSIGADQAIDYTREDFTKGQATYDLIFDIVANRSVSDYARVLYPGGVYVACAFNATSLFLGPLISRTRGKKIVSLIHKPNVSDLLVLKELFETGKVVSIIDNCYPLNELPAAVRRFDEGHARGKIVITM